MRAGAAARAAAALLFAAGARRGAAELTLNVYGNSALTGTPLSTKTIQDFNFSVPGKSAFSAEVVGTMTITDGEYKFDCDFGTANLAFLFIDDHLVCQTGAYSVAPQVTGTDNPLSKLSKAELPVRLEVYYSATPAKSCVAKSEVGCFDDANHQCGFSGMGSDDHNDWARAAAKCGSAGHTYGGAQNSVGKEIWCGDKVPTCPKLDASKCATNCPGNASQPCGGSWALEVFSLECGTSPVPTKPVDVTVSITTANPAPRMSAALPAVEQQRRTMQRGLANGWGPWNHNTLLDQVLLPSGAVATTALCKVSGGVVGDCQELARPDGNARAGIFAYDRSYGQFFFGSPNVSFTLSGGDDLHMLFSLVDGDEADARAGADGLAVVVYGGALWQRVVAVHAPNGTVGTTSTPASLTFDPLGLDPVTVYATLPAPPTPAPPPPPVPTYVGCYVDSKNRDLSYNAGDLSATDSPAACAAECRAKGHATKYIGVQDGNNCFCGDSYGSQGKAPDSDCNTPCAGDATLMCGGAYRNSIYATHNPSAAQPAGEPLRLAAGDGRPHIILPLTPGQPVGISTGKPMTVSDVAAVLEQKRVAEMKTYDKYGNLSHAAAAAQAGVMWNYIYTPSEAGPLAPVSRGWDFTNGKTAPEFGYVIFDWDNFFASYLLSIGGKEQAYSNLIQVVKSKTFNGFVPNFAAGTRKSQDRTEPPIGSKVLLEIYNKYKDKWLVELLFDDLLDWSNWFLAKRLLPPLNLISLGGSGMQGARFESGLDNSPMYDGNFYQGNTSQMLLYDVGMTSMFTMEAEALAELADAVGRPEAAELRSRGDAMRKLLLAELWDAESGTFVNKFQNGSFYRRVSPTSFYPMLTKGPSAAQADEMMTKWMMNRTRFCITPNGDYAGNSDDCYWGLPSISADDSAFPKLGYWRGYVWGPMMQLTYWGLQRYDDVPSVRTARKGLCKQMTGIMLNQWNLHGHICENFGPHKSTTDCTGNKFYHWGALGGMISLIENGYY